MKTKHTPKRIKNRAQFESAINEYAATGTKNPVEIARLLSERGCLCAAVAVEIYLQPAIKKAEGESK